MTSLLDDLAELTVVGSYSRLGYRRHAKAFHDDDLAVDLSGRVVVVTGATSGIGLAAARRLAALGATTVAVGRSRSKLLDAAEQIGAAEIEQADLSDLDEVSELADRLGSRFPRIDVLVHNAGVLLHERTLTAQGHEAAFATHVLAPFLLTERLRPTLRVSRPARLVWVSSGGMYTQRLDLERCQAKEGRYDGVVAYAQQKRAQVILSELFAARLVDDDIRSNAMHPGWVDTPGVVKGLPRFYRLTRPLLRDADEGADTIVWLAASAPAASENGGFWLDRRRRRTEIVPGTRHTDEEKRALWSLCEQLTAPWRSPLPR